MIRPEIGPRDITKQNCEVFGRAARLVSVALVAVALVGTTLALLGDQPSVRTVPITFAVALIEHLVLEAGALLLLSTLASSIGWRHLLVGGRALAERIRSATNTRRAPEAPPALAGQCSTDHRGGEQPSEIVRRLLDCLAAAPCAPPFDLHLAADRPVRTLNHIQVEVRKSP